MAEIRDLDLIRDIGILYSSKIILYGAGDYGNRAFRLLHQLCIPVHGICDSNKAKWGMEIGGHKVLSIQKLIRSFENGYIIIIAMADPNNVEQVLEILDSYKFSKIPCYTCYALKYTLKLHINDQKIEELFRKDFNIAKKIQREWTFYNHQNGIREFAWKLVLEQRRGVLVWQPSKVGSSSVLASLHKAKIPCVQIHNILPHSSWKELRFFDEYKQSVKEAIELLHHGGRIKIISLFRDPIGRSISKYFHETQFDYKIGDNPDIYQGIIDCLEKEITVGDYGAIFEWFNKEIRGFFGIDVYQSDFSKEKGYQIIHKDNVDLLLLKTERLNDCQQIIGQFVGVEDFKLVKANIGNDKLYKFLYNEVKRTIRIPAHVIDFYYKGNKAMDHFYTPEEKQQFIKKWSGK